LLKIELLSLASIPMHVFKRTT